MSHAIIVDTLQYTDKESVTKLLIDSYQQYEEVFRSPEAWQEYRESIQTSLDNPNLDEVLVAWYEGKIVGSIQMYTSGEMAYQNPEMGAIEHPVIRLLAVHPSARGLGVAQALIQESIKRATTNGADYLYLHTGDIMAKAKELYEWLGFKRDETYEFSNGDSVVRCYFYDLRDAVTKEQSKEVVV